MGIIEQMQEALRLLELTKDDLKEWVDAMAEGSWGNEDAIEESYDLIRTVESLLHDIGA